MSIYLVEPKKLVEEIAKKLKEYPEIKPPKNSEFWKTAFFKEFAPVDVENFWWIRCASLLRRVKKLGPVGVNRLRKLYGGRKRQGQGRNHSQRGAGKIVRVALQQLESAKLIHKTDKEGRIISSDGASLLDRTAYSIIRTKK